MQIYEFVVYRGSPYLESQRLFHSKRQSAESISSKLVKDNVVDVQDVGGMN